jgi:acetylornithine deacetylase
MLIEYKFFEPAFYSTDIPDWGTAYAWSVKFGPQAQVLVDLGHHASGVNIEQIVAFLLADLTLAVGHKGFVWLRVTCHGRAAHGSRPAEGRDAIAHMGRVLVALEALDRDLQARPPIAFQGTGSVHASFITGGREMSVYPDRCVLDIERRTVSGDAGASVLAEMQALVARLHAADPDLRAEVELCAERPPYRLDPSHALPAAIAASLTARERSAAPGGMSFWTDAAILGGAGIPSVLFGPGGAGLHSAVEYVHVDDVYVCRDVLVDVARRITGSL